MVLGSRLKFRGSRRVDHGPWALGHRVKSNTGKCSSDTIGRAWSWRWRINGVVFTTIQELAEAVELAERHVSRQLRLAYLVPEVLKRLTCGREASAVSLYDLCLAAGEAWGSGWRGRSEIEQQIEVTASRVLFTSSARQHSILQQNRRGQPCQNWPGLTAGRLQ